MNVLRGRVGPHEVNLNVLEYAYSLDVVRPSECCVASLGIIRGVCEVWDQARWCGLNTCVVDYVSLCVALLRGLWARPGCGRARSWVRWHVSVQWV